MLSARSGKLIHKDVGKMRAHRFTTISPLNWMGASRGERHSNKTDVHHDSVIKRHVRRIEHGTHVRTRCKLAASTSHAFALQSKARKGVHHGTHAVAVKHRWGIARRPSVHDTILSWHGLTWRASA